MEISHIFTDEAERLLDVETHKLATEIRQAAISVALRARGEPVEVTASDVRKARDMFARRKISIKSSTSRLLKMYIVFGAAIFVGGITYPILRSYIESADPISRTSLFIALSGLLISIVSLISMRYMYIVLESKSRQAMQKADKAREK